MLLFLHNSKGLLLKEMIAMSLPAIINRSRRHIEVRGRFAEDYSKEEVRQARIILLDIHWYPTIKPAIRLSHQLKAIHPKAILVAGGASAALFSEQILRDSAIDIILRGDGQIALEQLVLAVEAGRPLEDLPNLVGRDFTSPNWAPLAQPDLDDGDYRDWSWFPKMEERLQRIHRIADKRHLPVHPILTTLQGCPFSCAQCLGSLQHQERCFGRPPLLRSAERVRADLEAWSADPKVRFVNIFHDFLTTFPEAYWRPILSGRYDLSAYFEFFGLPSQKELAALLSAFRQTRLAFSMDNEHSGSTRLVNITDLIARIQEAQLHPGCDVTLCYIARGVNSEPTYRDALRRVREATQCKLHCSDWWWEEDNPLPDENGRGSEALYQASLKKAQRFRIFNLLMRGSLHVSALSPTLFALLEGGYAKIFHRPPLKSTGQ